MNPEFWLQRWSENRIGFHRSDVNPLLQRFIPNLPTGSRRILVPLCGKSMDMGWLVSRGYDVVGVDVSELAARALTTEQGIALDVGIEPPFKVYRGESLTYYLGDFFALGSDRAGKFQWIYDRAALIALPLETRRIYAERLKSFLEPEGRILLITIEYDQKRMDGPPFSVPESEVKSLFADFQIEKLHSYDCLDEEPQFKARGLDWMREVVYSITAA